MSGSLQLILDEFENNLDSSKECSSRISSKLENYINRFTKLANEMETMNKHIDRYKVKHRNICETIKHLEDVSEHFRNPFLLEDHLRKNPTQVSTDFDGFLEVVDEVKKSKAFFQQNNTFKGFETANIKLRELFKLIIECFQNEFICQLKNSIPSFESAENFLRFLFVDDPKYRDSLLKEFKQSGLIYVEDYIERLREVDSRFDLIFHELTDLKILRSSIDQLGGVGKKKFSLLLPFVCLLMEHFPVDEKIFFMRVPELKRMTRIAEALSSLKSDAYLKKYIHNRKKMIKKIMKSVYVSEKSKKKRSSSRGRAFSRIVRPDLQIRSQDSEIMRKNAIQGSYRKKRKRRPRLGDDDEEEEEDEGEEEGVPEQSVASPIFGDVSAFEEQTNPFIFYSKFFLRYLEEERNICSKLNRSGSVEDVEVFNQVIESNLRLYSDEGHRLAKKDSASSYYSSSSFVPGDRGNLIISEHNEQFFVFLELLDLFELHLRPSFEKVLLGTTVTDGSPNNVGGQTLLFSVVEKVFEEYRTRVISRFVGFKNELLSSHKASKKKKFLLLKSGKKKELLKSIHPAVSIAFSFFKRLFQSEEIVEHLLGEHFPDFRKGHIIMKNKKKKKNTFLGEYIRMVLEETITPHILTPVVRKARKKSEVYAVLFELNNMFHISNKLSEKGKLKEKLVSSGQQKLIQSYSKKVGLLERRFVEVTWDRACETLCSVTGENAVDNPRVKKNKKIVRKKYKEWERQWECVRMMSLPILNSRLRERVVELTKVKVLGPFKDFMEEYYETVLLMGEKGIVKYNEKTIRHMIDNDMYVDD